MNQTKRSSWFLVAAFCTEDLAHRNIEPVNTAVNEFNRYASLSVTQDLLDPKNSGRLFQILHTLVEECVAAFKASDILTPMQGRRIYTLFVAAQCVP